MHEWFSGPAAQSRIDIAQARAARHRVRVALGADLRTAVTRRRVARAEVMCHRIVRRRDDASVTLAAPLHA